MKNVLIVGASGGLARYVIEALKSLPGIRLTLFARNKNRIPAQLAAGCIVVEGDATNYNNVRQAVAGHDLVYVNLAGDLEVMTANIVRAMQEERVDRIIAVSSIGIYENPLRQVLIPYRKLADLIEASGLNYTILRPDWFTNSNEIDYAITHKGEAETGVAVSKKSIAAFIATIVASPDLHTNANLGISKPG